MWESMDPMLAGARGQSGLLDTVGVTGTLDVTAWRIRSAQLRKRGVDEEARQTVCEQG